MAIEEVAQNTQASFADPQNSTSPIDADEVTANDNALRAKFNTHDADTTIHVQGSALASRPAFGTAGRKWMTRDAGVVRLFRDTGSAWEEISYVPSASDATITGILTFSTAPVFTNNQAFAADVTVGDDLTVTDDAVVGGDLAVTGALDVDGATTLDAVLIAETLGVTGAVTMAATLGVTGAVTAASFAGAGSGITGLAAANLSGNASLGTIAASGAVTGAAGFVQTGGASKGQRTTSSGGNVTVDWSTTNHRRHTLSSSGTISFSNTADGQWLLLEVLQDGTGGWTPTFSGVTWGGNGTVPTPTTTAGRKDVYFFVRCGTDVLGFIADQNFASTT